MKKKKLARLYNNAAHLNMQPIPLEKVIKLFDYLAGMDDLAFGYHDDGCYARAHIMCYRLRHLGLNPKKIWAIDYRDGLTVELPNKKQEWDWHVAPTLSTLMPDGSTQELALDPALFNGPVTTDEWGETIHARSGVIKIRPLTASPNAMNSDYAPRSAYKPAFVRQHSREMLTLYSNLNDKNLPRPVFASKVRQQFGQAANSNHKSSVKLTVIASSMSP